MTKTRWKVTISPPSAKRMVGNGTLVVVRNAGWDGTFYDKYPLTADQTEAEFEISSCYEWICETSIIDGDSFDVYVEYKNATGSRSESRRLVPEKVGV